jgi:DNA polymerase III delta prime subunit
MLQLWQELQIKAPEQMIGNAAAVAALQQVTSGFVLLSGPIGCGKTSLALSFINQRFPGVDLKEEQTRCVFGKYYLEHCHSDNFMMESATTEQWFFNLFTPTILAIDEAHLLTDRRQSRLKTVCPRENFIIMLITSEPNKIEESIRSRCVKIRLGPLPATDLPVLCQRACEVVGVKYDVSIAAALNRAGINKGRNILNVIEALGRGVSLAQACADQ